MVPAELNKTEIKQKNSVLFLPSHTGNKTLKRKKR